MLCDTLLWHGLLKPMNVQNHNPITVEVDCQNVTHHVDLPSDKQLNQWVDAVINYPIKYAALNSITIPVSITIRIVDETEGATLNATWRQRQGATNVLSFPFDYPPGIGLSELTHYLLGDLVICAPVVEREAREQQKSLLSHWAHLVIHGTLHLLSYDHLDDHEAQLMEDLEIRILATLNYPNPY